MDDALRALNRAEHALAIAAHMESQWAAMLADNRYLENRNDDLARRVAELERRVEDLTALLLRVVS